MTPTRPEGCVRFGGCVWALFAAWTSMCSDVLAQADSLTWVAVVDSVAPDSLGEVDGVAAPLDSAWMARVDSAWAAWCAEAHCFSSDSGVWYAGEDSKSLAARLDTSAILRDLADLNRRSALDLAPHGAVIDRISFMMRRRPIFLGRMMGRAAHYFPMFEEALDRHGLPPELKYLPVLESGLNPLARSRAGATGLWQFMYNTARRQDLEINSWVDQRRDPQAATDAACRFLKRLNEIYDGDWHLALAAYNAGPGNVNKAIRRARSRDFWTVRRFLPRETAKYVPSIVALAYLFAHPVECGIVPSEPLIPRFALDTVVVHRNIRFDQVARVTGRTVAEIAQLNPQYRKEVVPGEIGGGWPIVLPLSAVGAFIDGMPEALEWEPYRTPEVKFEPEVTVYRVRNGDVLGTIARRHGVSVRELRQWNSLRGDMIRVGQKLYIHADSR
ncbi:MAG: LysM peptidoglycan-binding domain-containing protein [Crocinitomicaceae bacterium TMED114]|nr:MAG: LysM peptidoglycan-binding domain-containing protein [Crocinitomicaceae bacterium TMED114]